MTLEDDCARNACEAEALISLQAGDWRLLRKCEVQRSEEKWIELKRIENWRKEKEGGKKKIAKTTVPPNKVLTSDSVHAEHSARSCCNTR